MRSVYNYQKVENDDLISTYISLDTYVFKDQHLHHFFAEYRLPLLRPVFAAQTSLRTSFTRRIADVADSFGQLQA
jgi:hypothetical protein